MRSASAVVFSGLLAAALLLLPAQAYPHLWTTKSSFAGFSNCTAHPTTLLGKASAPKHSAPRVNGGITFGVPAKVCPGATTPFTVTLPETAHAMFTVSQGSVGLRYSGDSCTNRYVMAKNARTNKWSDNLTLPCGAKGTVVMRVTYSTAKGSPLEQNQATLTIDPKCAAAACAGRKLRME